MDWTCVQEVATLAEPLICRLQIFCILLFIYFFRIPGLRPLSVSLPREKLKKNKIKRKEQTLNRDKETRKFHQSSCIFLKFPTKGRRIYS